MAGRHRALALHRLLLFRKHPKSSASSLARATGHPQPWSKNSQTGRIDSPSPLRCRAQEVSNWSTCFGHLQASSSQGGHEVNSAQIFIQDSRAMISPSSRIYLSPHSRALDQTCNRIPHCQDGQSEWAPESQNDRTKDAGNTQRAFALPEARPASFGFCRPAEPIKPCYSPTARPHIDMWARSFPTQDRGLGSSDGHGSDQAQSSLGTQGDGILPQGSDCMASTQSGEGFTSLDGEGVQQRSEQPASEAAHAGGGERTEAPGLDAVEEEVGQWTNAPAFGVGQIGPDITGSGPLQVQDTLGSQFQREAYGWGDTGVDEDELEDEEDLAGVDVLAGMDPSMAGAPKRVQRFLIQRMLKVKPQQEVSRSELRKMFQMRIVDINRTSKVTKGGRIVSYGALVICGNGNGVVGFGRGKSAEVGQAVDKAFARSLRNLHYFDRYRGRTVFCEQMAKYGKTKVYIWPARKGSSMSAGATVGGILRLAGFSEVKTKVIGSRNPINTVKATFKALGMIDAASDASQQHHSSLI